MQQLFDLNTEKAIIGGLIHMAEDKITTLNQIINSINGVDAFYVKAHQHIYNAIKYLVEENKPIDLIIISQLLNASKLLTTEQDTEYLAEIYNENVSYANIEAYTHILNEKYHLRELKKLCRSFNDLASQQNIDNASNGLSLTLRMQDQLNELTNKHAYKQHDNSNKTKMVSYFKTLEDRFENSKNGINGIATNIKHLDQKIKGLRPGQLIVIAGESSSGKSAFALNIASCAALKQNKKTLLFSLEMADEMIFDRLIASDQQIPAPFLLDGSAVNNDIYAAKLTAFASNFAKNDNLQIADNFNVTIEQIKQTAYLEKIRNEKLDLIVVDYLQLLAKEQGRTRAEEIAGLTRGFKLLARELNIPIILLSQLNRNKNTRTNKRPTLGDLKESSAIEQDADIVIFIYREKQYNPNYNEDVAEINIAKGRSIETGTIYTNYIGEFFYFKPIEQDDFKPYYPSSVLVSEAEKPRFRLLNNAANN